MKIKALIIAFVPLLFLPEITLAICDLSYQTYTYKSAYFYVRNAKKIRVTVYNSMNDLYARCFTAWIKTDGKYINLDGLPYSPENWQEAWKSTAPSCYDCGYRIVSGYSGYVEYDLEKYAPYGYTGEVEVRVSSYCYEIEREDPCFCWEAEVEVIEYYQPQTCYLDISVKDLKRNPINAYVYVDGNYLGYGSHFLKEVSVGAHKILAKKSGYNSDAKIVSCSCNETKKVEILLAPTQVCVPGEIRNRYCACPTQVAYERCKNDGSGFETVIENCASGYTCEEGYCVKTCEEGYTNEYRCYGNWVQRKYVFSDCSSNWINWKYCSYGCSQGRCLTKEPCKISVSVSKPENVFVDETVRTTIRLTNSGDEGCYVNLDAYVCNIDYCYLMNCNDYSTDPRVYVQGKGVYVLNCNANIREEGSYKVKVSYAWLNQTQTVYSETFLVKKRDEPKCTARFLEEFKCDGNWRMQLYQYSDCSVGWGYVNYCSYGCKNGECLPEPKESLGEEKVSFTGLAFLADQNLLILLVLILLVLIGLLAWVLMKRTMRKRNKPEEFG
ncbi:MAG: PEGA domain-containing protein [Candidatus Aenigmatarchaeota archaeon]